MLSNASIKMMINKLKIEADHGRIENEWESNFINEMYTKSRSSFSFTHKQIDKIEELFEKN
jgi:hypothetical protein